MVAEGRAPRRALPQATGPVRSAAMSMTYRTRRLLLPLAAALPLAALPLAALPLAALPLADAAASPARAATPVPSWRLTPTGTDAQFRGLDAVSGRVAWVAGSAGTVLRTTDAGSSWDSVGPASAGKVEFRDVEAFGPGTAVVASIGAEPGQFRFYRTENGGRSWRLSFRNADPRAFYDCMTFSDREHGMALSDPVDGRFRILATSDGGRSWHVRGTAGMPPALAGEFAFAASGTCIVSAGPDRAWFATGGGAKARVFATTDGGRSWVAHGTPVASGPTAGIYSLAVRNRHQLLAIGGDYRKPAEAYRSLAVSGDGGRTWGRIAREQAPAGYRSGSAYIPGSGGTALAVGPTGSDVSTDGGLSWRQFAGGTFDSVDCAPDGACWASGVDGRVARLQR